MVNSKLAILYILLEICSSATGIELGDFSAIIAGIMWRFIKSLWLTMLFVILMDTGFKLLESAFESYRRVIDIDLPPDILRIIFLLIFI